MSSATRSASGTEDSPELEALFDTIARAARERSAGAASSGQAREQLPAEKVISQLGQLTRRLHDTLRELGYDKLVHQAAQAIPDAQERLAYVATMSEQAAVRALAAVEAAKPIQQRLRADAAMLAEDWDRLYNRQLGIEEFKALADRTRSFLSAVPARTDATSARLTDIMMAQDFHDLTGQVIKRTADIVKDLETQLLQLLLDNCPLEQREAAERSGLLHGPVIDGVGRDDIVTSQSQVDALLASLGF
ncbi:MAG TPA: protein phosphatase CheZ [Burkholderiales bacterium]|nr:protein phosphatase CheZ [Burkholderiales bacterium]